MGRQRLPSAIAELRGTYAKNPDRRNEREPVVITSIPDEPDDLSERALNEWRRVASEMAALKVIAEQDRAAVYQYARLWQQWREALDDVEEWGQILTKAESGDRYENPASRLAGRLADQLHKYLCQFGLTPAARTRVQTLGPSQQGRMRRQR